jgi:hypothetical protein
MSSSRGFVHGYFARWVTELGFQHCHLSSPLYGLTTIRYRRGSAVTPAPGGRGLHPHSHLVVMILMAFASITKPVIPKYFYLFRQNESHCQNNIVTYIEQLYLRYTKLYLELASFESRTIEKFLID